MGFFDILFGNKKAGHAQVVDERIWMTTNAKFAGIEAEVAERAQSESVAILLVAHFPDVHARLEKIAAQPTKVPVMAVLADKLSTDIADRLHLDRTATIDLIIGERHPLPSVDEHLEQFSAKLPCHCRFSHHLSLEDAVIKVFAGEWVMNMLQKLGMKEDEAIESKMVSRRIKQAQQQIESRTFGKFQAKSAAEWLEKNCPDLIKP